MIGTVAFFNGVWVALDEVRLHVDDVGFFQAATAVERLRTWNGRLPPLDEHLKRFARSTAALRISPVPNAIEWTTIIERLVQDNPGDDDVGITLFATPGRRGPSQPTLCAHLTRLDHARIARLGSSGQPLVITDVRQPPSESWSRSIKVRCRLHYYLADMQANDRAPGGLGVLIDDDGSITETSTSNVMMVSGETLVMPPESRVLPGVMAGVVCRLATEAGLEILRRPIMPDEVRWAEEVWLTGSEAGLWFASEVDGLPKRPATRCTGMQQTLRHWLESRG
jgi:branched-chain amino acid aminotransferase